MEVGRVKQTGEREMSWEHRKASKTRALKWENLKANVKDKQNQAPTEQQAGPAPHDPDGGEDAAGRPAPTGSSDTPGRAAGPRPLRRNASSEKGQPSGAGTPPSSSRCCSAARSSAPWTPCRAASSSLPWCELTDSSLGTRDPKHKTSCEGDTTGYEGSAQT